MEAGEEQEDGLGEEEEDGGLGQGQRQGQARADEDMSEGGDGRSSRE